jgi:hypothetical protein
MAQLYMSENLSEVPSKKDGKIYKYITKLGIPIAFERKSIWYNIWKDNENSDRIKSKVIKKPKDITKFNFDQYLSTKIKD